MVRAKGNTATSGLPARCRELGVDVGRTLGGLGVDELDARAREGFEVKRPLICAKYCADAVELAERHLTPDAVANRPRAEKPQEQPSPIVIGAGSGAAGLALGAGAMAVIAYERRRAENEGR